MRSKRIISDEDVTVIFINIGKLLEIHSKLLSELKGNKDRFGEIFLSVVNLKTNKEIFDINNNFINRCHPLKRIRITGEGITTGTPLPASTSGPTPSSKSSYPSKGSAIPASCLSISWSRC